jgi:hypothetical protein
MRLGRSHEGQVGIDVWEQNVENERSNYIRMYNEQLRNL